jgi:sulfate adenylyltransferase subunit 1
VLTSALGWADGAVLTIPVSALLGDNIVDRSAQTPWYTGPTLLEHLESVPVLAEEDRTGLRFPVQYVIRPRTAGYSDYRGYAGQVAAGVVSPGDAVVVLPGGHRSRVLRIDTADGPLDQAGTGRSVTLLLADDLDVSRGDLIAAAATPPRLTAELDATLCWLAERSLRAGARILVKHGTRTTPAIVTSLGPRLDTDTLAAEPAERLQINDIGRVSLRTAEALPVDDYADARFTGAFLVIDPADGVTLAAGLVGRDLISAGP